ncbi:hypothetical protein Tco_0991783 [Tanacetum coccineum]|uniref:Reverse transcriptase domain-containing protein n=1 Tax=Tanacetum coccineum TaxID=301880 RepID=A0ABQ5F0J8_9ASTR
MNPSRMLGKFDKKKEEEEGLDWVVRSKFEDEMDNFMMEKKYHLKGLREMLHQQRNDMHEKFSQILSTLDDKTSNKEPTLAIITKSETTTCDPLYPNHPNSAPIVTNEITAEKEYPKELTPKEGRSWKFHITMSYRNNASKNALADLGASINLMPHSRDRPFSGNGISEVFSETYRRWVFTLLIERTRVASVPIILGRPFLATARVVIDVYDGKLSLRVGEERVTFNIGKSMKFASSQDDCLYFTDHTDEMVQEQLDDTLDPSSL